VASKTEDDPSLPWPDRFAPQGLADLVGRSREVATLTKFLREGYKRGSPICVVHGPPGVGKSLAIRLLLREHGFSAVEVNGSMERSTQFLVSQLGTSISQNTPPGRRFALVFEEMDGIWVDDTAKGVIPAFREWLTRNKERDRTRPILFTANTIHGPAKLKQRLRGLAQFIRFGPLPETTLRVLWTRVGQKANALHLDFRLLVAQAQGDARQFLLTAQVAALGRGGRGGGNKKDLELDPFQLVSEILGTRTTRASSAALAFHLNATPYALPLLAENVHVGQVSEGKPCAADVATLTSLHAFLDTLCVHDVQVCSYFMTEIPWDSLVLAAMTFLRPHMKMGVTELEQVPQTFPSSSSARNTLFHFAVTKGPPPLVPPSCLRLDSWDARKRADLLAAPYLPECKACGWGVDTKTCLRFLCQDHGPQLVHPECADHKLSCKECC